LRRQLYFSLILAACAPRAPLSDADATLDGDAGAPDAAEFAEAMTSDGHADAQDALISCANIHFRSIAAGWNHTLAIGVDGALWAFGANGSGQLGLGDTRDRARATRINVDGRWTALAGGSRHSCAIREDKTLWCWGVNVHGQLGTGDTIDRSIPQRVGAESDWVEVACGGLHTCAIREGGALYCWGSNPAGQLGLGEVSGDRTTPQRVGTSLGWRGLASKARFNCALREGESLWCWGDNSDGQLGTSDAVDRRAPVRISEALRWAQVRVGPLHTCAITVDHALYCWGLNDFGQLGTGDATSARVATRVGVRADWRLVSAGFEHTCAVDEAARLHCWGNAALAQTGHGVTTARSAPEQTIEAAAAISDVLTGQGHSCAQTATAALWCWGDNASGQAAPPTRQAVRATPGEVCGER
jgi:alpha-tubulin suppressor-like RCC1 family protein